ncbi:MAG: RsiV family protein [Treponema sp.]|jgi:hypothetical protein|nr:RsiV family protein [Treponema sp.]
MKNRNLYALLLALLASLLFMVGCISVPNIERPKFTLQNYSFSVLFEPKQVKSPRLEFVLTLLEANYPKEQVLFINEVLYGGNTPEEYKDQLILERRGMFRDANLTARNPEEEAPATFNWKYHETINLLNPEDTQSLGTVIKREKDFYAGGAHGIQTTDYFVLDLETQTVLTINDMFNDFQSEDVHNIVYAMLRKSSELAEGRPLSSGIFFDDRPELSVNFFVTQDGLGLHWDPYEITPYSEGSFEVILPWAQIRPLLKHSGMETLTKFGVYLFVGQGKVW